MTRAIRDPRHLILTLSGEPARSLADRLLAGGAEHLDEVWAETFVALGAPTGGASRVGHDWDPATGRLTVAATP
jgi:hypothetical protein